ncbi:MAG: tetratricopeptide repeat protein, partial [Calditrichaeota bacterium]|nr:tetratricopeptide repeat protein [Calditrichota bacterium]
MKSIIVLFLNLVSLLFSQSVSQIEPYKKLPQAYKYYLETDYEAAIEAFKKRKETHITLYNIAFLYYLKGDFNKSLEYTDKSIKDDNGFAWSYYLSALNYRKLNQQQKAITYFKLAIDEDDDQSKFFFELADTYRSEKQLDAAIENYREGLNIKPDEAAYQVKLARLLIETKKADKKE